MTISLVITKENKDGSADAIVRFEKDDLGTLIQWGIIAMLTKGADAYKVKPEEYDGIIQRAKELVNKK
jgi:hypothetical protein